MNERARSSWASTVTSLAFVTVACAGRGAPTFPPPVSVGAESESPAATSTSLPPTATPSPRPSPSPSLSPPPSQPPIARAPFDGPGFSFIYPAGWRPATGVAFGGTYKFTNGAGGAFGFEYVFSVSQAAVGDPIKVPLGQDAGVASISGTTLDAIAASVEQEIQVSSPNRVAVTIGGEPGFRYSTPEASIVGPLASIAIAIHDGRTFVFMENLALDAPASGDFETFLQGVTFT